MLFVEFAVEFLKDTRDSVPLSEHVIITFAVAFLQIMVAIIEFRVPQNHILNSYNIFTILDNKFLLDKAAFFCCAPQVCIRKSVSLLPKRKRKRADNASRRFRLMPSAGSRQTLKDSVSRLTVKTVGLDIALVDTNFVNISIIPRRARIFFQVKLIVQMVLTNTTAMKWKYKTAIQALSIAVLMDNVLTRYFISTSYTIV